MVASCLRVPGDRAPGGPVTCWIFQPDSTWLQLLPVATGGLRGAPGNSPRPGAKSIAKGWGGRPRWQVEGGLTPEGDVARNKKTRNLGTLGTKDAKDTESRYGWIPSGAEVQVSSKYFLDKSVIP